ncbi:MAG: hypothetical protein ACOYVK_18950 [Bacillota bacterium]
MNDFLKPFGSQSFFVGLGVAAIAYLLGPQIKESVRPMAVKGMQGALMISDKTKNMMEEGKDRLEDMMEKTNLMGKDQKHNEQAAVYEMLIKELREDKENSNRILEQLNQTMSGLKDEISKLKNGSAKIAEDHA